MKPEMLRTFAAVNGLILLVGGVALVSIPWAMIVGGGVVLLAAVVGEMRSK